MQVSVHLLVLSTLLLLAVCDAQSCTKTSEFKCLNNMQYLPCTANGPDYSKAPVSCKESDITPAPESGSPLGCYGIGTLANICFVASCPQGYGNYPIPKVTNAHYTCVGNPPVAVSTVTCPPGSLYDKQSRRCSVVTTTTTTTTTTRAPPPPPSTTPTCSGQDRLPDPTSCNHFYVCAGASSGPGTRTKCLLRMRYDISSRTCKSRLFTNCGTRPDTSD